MKPAEHSRWTIGCEEGKHDDCKGWGETIFQVPRQRVTCKCPCHSHVDHEAEIAQLEADQLTGAEVAGADVARAARQLWEAAVELWYDVDDQGDPIPLAVSLYDSSNAYDGMPIKGRDLYWIGVALGFIEEEDHPDA